MIREEALKSQIWIWSSKFLPLVNIYINY